MTSRPEPVDPVPLLRPLLAPGAEPLDAVPAPVIEELRTHLTRLGDLGFRVEVGRSQVRIRNPARGFVTVVHLSQADDLGERRDLFRRLRARFGTFWDRYLPWLFATSRQVAEPYESLRVLIERCQEVREGSRSAA